MKICLVCTHGGHFKEMKKIESALDGFDFFYASYSIGNQQNSKGIYLLEFRKKNQKSYWELFSLCTRSISFAFRVLLKENPDVIITTGGGEIAVPFCYIGKLFGKHIIYIETLARINKPSVGGKLVYPIANLFLVQWKKLLLRYGKKAKYWGNVL
jgi:beta-1,4-N-acetylglucosaminyltransferase